MDSAALSTIFDEALAFSVQHGCDPVNRIDKMLAEEIKRRFVAAFDGKPEGVCHCQGIAKAMDDWLVSEGIRTWK